jgi:hypothetical protein
MNTYLFFTSFITVDRRSVRRAGRRYARAFASQGRSRVTVHRLPGARTAGRSRAIVVVLGPTIVAAAQRGGTTVDPHHRRPRSARECG